MYMDTQTGTQIFHNTHFLCVKHELIWFCVVGFNGDTSHLCVFFLIIRISQPICMTSWHVIGVIGGVRFMCVALSDDSDNIDYFLTNKYKKERSNMSYGQHKTTR